VTQCYVEYSKAITRRYVSYREVLLDTKFEKLRAMLHSAESQLRAMQVEINSLISARNLNRIKNILGCLSSIYEKIEGQKSRDTVSLSHEDTDNLLTMIFYIH
jgi:hypothetical protein